MPNAMVFHKFLKGQVISNTKKKLVLQPTYQYQKRSPY